MKAPFFVAVACLALVCAGVNQAGAAGHKGGKLEKLARRVDDDLASGALTKPDADELTMEIARVKEMKANSDGLTKKSRRDVRQDVRKIEANLERKEKQAKALSTASPTP